MFEITTKVSEPSDDKFHATRYNRDQYLPTTSFMTTETEQVSETLGVNSEVGLSPKKSLP
jgi:hypothetical protein